MRAVTTREPLYTEQDRAELLALDVYRAGLCPLCGRPREVCTAPEGTYQIDTVWEVCQATRAVAEIQAGTYTDDNYPHRRAHLWGARLTRR